MSPAIKTNSMVFVKETPFDTLEKGNVIAFSQQNTVVVHRIFDIDYAGKIALAKGDNVNSFDEVSADYIIGRVSFSVPLIGGLADVFSDLFKLIIFLLIIAALIIIYIVLNEILKKQLTKNQKAKEQA